MKRERAALPKRGRYVLPTESAEQFESEHLAFENAIKPRDKIEQMHVEDVSYHNWKTSERRRIGFAIFKAALIEALYDLLTRQLGARDSGNAQILVERWAKGDSGAKVEVIEILKRYGLDETAIEAEAYTRCCGKLAVVEQSEALHASRRDKILPNLAFYREMIARQSQRETNLSQEDDRLARIEHMKEGEDRRGH
ncbi:hypothetical protein Q2941_10370 [Bradyrhizobium sp. UFLA05-153]